MSSYDKQLGYRRRISTTVRSSSQPKKELRYLHEQLYHSQEKLCYSHLHEQLCHQLYLNSAIRYRTEIVLPATGKLTNMNNSAMYTSTGATQPLSEKVPPLTGTALLAISLEGYVHIC
jgi:hypothetical protein